MNDEPIARNEKRIDELRFPFGLLQECGRFHGGISHQKTCKPRARRQVRLGQANRCQFNVGLAIEC